MNIAFFFTYGYSLKTWEESGTLERELKTLRILSKNYGYKFTLVTYGDISDTLIKNISEEFKIIPIYSIIKKRNSKFINYLFSFTIPFKLRNTFKNIDVIHQHQLLGSWVVIILKFLVKKPLLTRTGYDMYLFAKNEKKNVVVRYLYKLLTRFTIWLSDIYTVTSISDFNYLNTSRNTKKKLLYRPNFIEQNETNPLENRYENKILAVGRLVEQKNFKILIEEFKNTKDDFEITIVGEGRLENELKALALKNNVDLKLIGSVSYEELKNIYQNYRYFISTSLFEGNPKTLLEAMASGCVVLASNISNHSEIIKNELNGYIFNLNNPQLLKKINQLKNDFNLQTKISNNAINEVYKNNSLENLISLLDEDYKLIKS